MCNCRAVYVQKRFLETFQLLTLRVGESLFTCWYFLYFCISIIQKQISSCYTRAVLWYPNNLQNIKKETKDASTHKQMALMEVSNVLLDQSKRAVCFPQRLCEASTLWSWFQAWSPPRWNVMCQVNEQHAGLCCQTVGCSSKQKHITSIHTPTFFNTKRKQQLMLAKVWAIAMKGCIDDNF